MTTPTDRPARDAVYSALMWPKWNQQTESHGVGADKAKELLDAMETEAAALAVARQILGTPAAPAVTEEPETEEQRADRLATERDHTAGDHQYCGLTCEAEFPSDMLRNAILARAIPGSARMLDELLRRAALPSPAAEAQPASVSPTAVLLATPCDACEHTLNWHRNDARCTVPRCVCGRFQQPTP
ncbi:hypothetical protein [Streptomyces sp. NPDC002346]